MPAGEARPAFVDAVLATCLWKYLQAGVAFRYTPQAGISYQRLKKLLALNFDYSWQNKAIRYEHFDHCVVVGKCLCIVCFCVVLTGARVFSKN